jgi:predicted N-formylglutamate amidohydrolase
MKLILSCEHGGNSVPALYKKYFLNRNWLLRTHRGWDPGALSVAKNLKRTLQIPLVFSETSRLLVDLNRELHDPTLFSVVTAGLHPSTKNLILKKHFEPYYQRLRALVLSQIKQGQVLHLSIHSFTPVRLGVRRETDLGLLFHKGDKVAEQFCKELRLQLNEIHPQWQVDFNKPYRADGTGIMLALKKDLRLQFGKPYSGVYIEVNQKHLKSPAKTSFVADQLALAIRNLNISK